MYIDLLEIETTNEDVYRAEGLNGLMVKRTSGLTDPRQVEECEENRPPGAPSPGTRKRGFTSVQIGRSGKRKPTEPTPITQDKRIVLP